MFKTLTSLVCLLVVFAGMKPAKSANLPVANIETNSAETSVDAQLIAEEDVNAEEADAEDLEDLEDDSEEESSEETSEGEE